LIAGEKIEDEIEVELPRRLKATRRSWWRVWLTSVKSTEQIFRSQWESVPRREVARLLGSLISEFTNDFNHRS
jgi:hypothetical protein